MEMRKFILHPSTHHLVLHKQSPFTEVLLKTALCPNRNVTTITSSDGFSQSSVQELFVSLLPEHEHPLHKLRIIGGRIYCVAAEIPLLG